MSIHIHVWTWDPNGVGERCRGCGAVRREGLFDVEDVNCLICGRPLLGNKWCGWCHHDERQGRHRRNDQPTSIAAARDVAYRSGSQKALLLEAFRAAFPDNMTDEEAATAAGISLTSEYSKRCGELRQDGKIRQISGVTRAGAAGIHRLVSVYST